MPDITCIYYTGNYDNPKLEERVRQTLSDTVGDVPIISVSQKPINLGHNICVGDVGRSEQNLWRQVQIGAKEAKTKFICPAEADTLYPKEYFQFIPPREDIFYFAKPLYLCFNQRAKKRYFAMKPRGSESSMVIGREYLIYQIDKLFGKMGITDMWGPMRDKMFLFMNQKREYFELPVPCVTFKTDRNMHRKSPHIMLDRIEKLPYWGNVKDLLNKYFV